MKLEEAQEKFIQAWGSLSSSWGINRTMGQVHALLLISPEAKCTEEVMETLNISRGNANMNLRHLVDWGLLYKEFKTGERKDYFVAEKNVWKIARQVMQERRKRELEPLLRLISQLREEPIQENSQEAKTFRMEINQIKALAEKTDAALDKFANSDESWFLRNFLKILE